jgi:carboxypeptidase C (cathepsin A)
MTLSTLILILNFILKLSSCTKTDEVHELFLNYKGKIYSGSLDTHIDSRKLHYVFVESQNNPKTDPVVLWLNGGPACSSLTGFIKENGPYIFKEKNEPFTKLENKEPQPNPYSWNKIANIIYLESPGGVGFSKGGSWLENSYYNDSTTALENKTAIENFYRKFDSFITNDLYIAGESYAGVYIPSLVKVFLDDKNSNIDIKGILIGNPYTSRLYDNMETFIDYMTKLGYINKPLYDLYYNECIKPHGLNDAQPKVLKAVSKECNKIRLHIKETLNKLDTNNIKNRQCTKRLTVFSTLKAFDNGLTKLTHELFQRLHLNYIYEYLWPSEAPISVYPDDCDQDDGFIRFLNNNREKLNASGKIWEQCSTYVSSNYELGCSLQLYPNLLGKIRIWLYSGENDGMVPRPGTERWIESLGLKRIRLYNWMNDGSVVGEFMKYITDEEKELTFVTVRDAGHFVPENAPEAAFAIFKAFLEDEPLPSARTKKSTLKSQFILNKY